MQKPFDLLAKGPKGLFRKIVGLTGFKPATSKVKRPKIFVWNDTEQSRDDYRRSSKKNSKQVLRKTLPL